MRKIIVSATKPVAVDSPDHITPCGTANDNSTNEAYVDEMIARFGPDMVYVDMGCAGGGFVKQFIDKGVLAIGLEGSDYSKKMKRAEWATIPDNLFTCDLTAPFLVQYEDTKELVTFDLISGFELMEHLTEAQIDFFIPNMASMLKPHGIFVCSISTVPHGDWHQTVQNEEWWDAKFAQHGMERTESIINYGRIEGSASSFGATYKKA